MKSILDIATNIIIIGAIVLSILSNLNCLHRLQHNNKKLYGFVTAVRIVGIFFLFVYTVSNVPYYFNEIKDGNKAHALLKTLFVSSTK